MIDFLGRLQVAYEQWLGQQQQLIRLQQNYYETEVNKFRKQRKSLNSRQRQLRKNGQELNETDTAELERITSEQQALQKQLDQVRPPSHLTCGPAHFPLQSNPQSPPPILASISIRPKLPD